MTRSKTETARANLMKRVRRQRLKYVAMLPSLITILNGVCGFASIVLSSRGQFAGAGYMIFLAMIADMLDGRLARMSHSTSSFGGQLDSLCDVVSFGVAPAFLMLQIVEAKLLGLQLSGDYAARADFVQRFVWLASATYLSCATIRLARFNVENEEDTSSHMSFVGLPTPAAAGAIASLVVFHQEMVLAAMSSGASGLYSMLDNVIVYCLTFVVLGTGILMVSRIRYPHLLNYYLKGKKPLGHLVRVLLFIGVICWNRQAALVLIFCGFAASSFVKWLYMRVARHIASLARTSKPLETEQQQS